MLSALYCTGAALDVEIIPAFHDNYLFAVPSRSGNSCFVVDPGDANVILAFLKTSGLTLEAILVTHHHADHIGGVLALKVATGCRRIIGPQYDSGRIPHLTELVKENDVINVGGYSARVLFTPGHTSGHICYHFMEGEVLFCGDTLFSVGCGRMFEGDQNQMWQSMKIIRGLPELTKVFCAHEYTLSNINFARSIDKHNAALAEFYLRSEALRQNGRPTVPTTIGDQKKVNPFFRCDDDDLKAVMGMVGQEGAAVFGALRSAKDLF